MLDATSRKGVSLDPLFPAPLGTTITLVLALMLAGGRAGAQEAQREAPVERATSRHLLVGDLAFELRSPMRGTLMMGFADERNAVSLEVRSTDARRWADSVRRLLALRPLARPKGRAAAKGAAANATRRVRAVLEEPGVGAGSLLLTRVDSAGATRWTLYAADGDLAEVREVLESSEARVVANVVRTAAVASAPPPLRTSPRPKGARRPAKAGASPPRMPPRTATPPRKPPG